jgi:hypothetical protein
LRRGDGGVDLGGGVVLMVLLWLDHDLLVGIIGKTAGL